MSIVFPLSDSDALRAAGRSNKECYTRWLRHVRPAMMKAAEHLRAKKAAEAEAAGRTDAAVDTDKRRLLTKEPLANSDKTMRANKPMEAASARRHMQQMHRGPTLPTNEKPPVPTPGAQPNQTMKPKAIPVSKPPMVRPAAAPNPKPAVTSGVSAQTSVTSQTKEGYMFEMKMRRDHAELCSRLPASAHGISQKTLTDAFSGSELSRLCGSSNE